MIRIKRTTDTVTAKLNQVVSTLENPRPIFDSIATEVSALISQEFRDSKDPYGTPWAPLSPVTLERRRGRSAQILKDFGTLMERVLQHEISGTGVIFETNYKPAVTHQYGAAYGEYGTTSRGGPIPWGDIPARSFYPRGNMPKDWERSIVDVIEAGLGLLD